MLIVEGIFGFFAIMWGLVIIGTIITIVYVVSGFVLSAILWRGDNRQSDEIYRTTLRLMSKKH